jgi:hypothetical protein
MGWLGRLLGRAGGSQSRYAVQRSHVLSLNPDALQIPEGHWFGASVALMEIAQGGGTASLVAVADGTVSLYSSGGHGTTGAGEHLAVREAAERFLQASADAAQSMTATSEFPLPQPGQVRFHVRTPAGDMTVGVPEALLRARRHQLGPLYVAGQDVLTEIRMLDEGRRG